MVKDMKKIETLTKEQEDCLPLFRNEYSIEVILIAILINLAFIYFVIKFIPKIENLIGDTGINILRKVFGIILLSIAIKLFSKNLAMLFHFSA